jgi:hypothetical protein
MNGRYAATHKVRILRKERSIKKLITAGEKRIQII